ncbi:MAG: hypothetical protein OXH56_06535 [Gemmatimonadetes bacterium]|nr:hypothetical protein [Gemmatimonadota bacterium]
MTAIFHTNAGSPVLAGDMLISVPGPTSTTDLRLPSHPNGVSIPIGHKPEFIPILMRRKIFRVNNSLAVGASGSALHIQYFIEDLFETFKNKSEFESTEIMGFLDNYSISQRGKEVAQNVGAIILVEATDWRGTLVLTYSSYKNLSSRRYGNVVTIGTGSETIVEQIAQFDTNYKYGISQPKDHTERLSEFETLSRNLFLLAHLYWREFVTPSKVFDAWGGAYDMIYQDSKRVFRYLNDYTIVLRKFDACDAQKGIQLLNVLKYERRPELSFITMLNNGMLDFYGAKDITSNDDSLMIAVNEDDFSMNSKLHISIIAVCKANQYLAPIVQIDGTDGQEKTMQTVITRFDDDGSLCVGFHVEHDKWIEEQVMSYYEKNKNRL